MSASAHGRRAEARVKRACARHSTAVACMFAPPEREKQVYLEGDAAGKKII